MLLSLFIIVLVLLVLLSGFVLFAFYCSDNINRLLIKLEGKVGIVITFIAFLILLALYISLFSFIMLKISEKVYF